MVQVGEYLLILPILDFMEVLVEVDPTQTTQELEEAGGGYTGGAGGNNYKSGVAYGAGGGGGSYGTTMIVGNASMPSTSGGTETGHSGNGYARITLVE